MATWPTTLPQVPLAAGYSEKPANNSIRSRMDVGPAKSRRRISAGVRDHKCSFILTKAQVAILEEFYATTLQSGSLSYSWLHPRTQAATVWRIKTLPDYSYADGRWYTSLDLEQLP